MTPEHADVIERIRKSARDVEKAVAAIPADKLSVAAANGEWSVRQVLLHTRDVALLAYGLRIRRCLLENKPQFVSYEEDEFHRIFPFADVSAEDIARVLVAEHDAVAGLLAGLPDDAWQRSGRGPDGNMRSIEDYAGRFVAHAEEHAAQIAAIRL
jgi:hypothetical protein